MPPPLRDRARTLRNGLVAWVGARGPDLAMQLTLLDLLLVPVGAWSVRPAVLVVAAAGLLHRSVLRSPWTWLLLFFLTGWRVVDDWPQADNHAYLLCYWCLALFLTATWHADSIALARSARLLIGLSMALAALWKGVLSVDYLDGRFFRVLFLTDDRFADFARVFGSMPPDALEQARDLLEHGRHETKPLTPDSLETARLRTLAAIATWATLVFEAAIALLFLLGDRLRAARQRDAALLLFCAVTYAIAPVPGFGWLLLAMGVAQCPPEARRTRLAYLAVFVLLVVYDNVPWIAVLWPE